MILSAFNTLISSNTLVLEEAKGKLRDSVSKDFKSQVLSQIPSPEGIKDQLSTSLITVEDLNKLEKKFNSLKSRCQSQISKIDNKIKQIESIKAKTKSIDDRFTSLEEVIEIGNQFLPTIKIIITTAPTILAFLGGIGTGLAIVKINDGLKIAKAKVSEFEAIIKVLDAVKNKINNEVTPINKQCDNAIEILIKLKSQIEINCNYIDTVFLQAIAQFSNLLDPVTETTDPTPQFKNPEEILSNLENSNKEKFFQYLQDLEGNTGYQIIKK